MCLKACVCRRGGELLAVVLITIHLPHSVLYQESCHTNLCALQWTVFYARVPKKQDCSLTRKTGHWWEGNANRHEQLQNKCQVHVGTTHTPNTGRKQSYRGYETMTVIANGDRSFGPSTKGRDTDPYANQNICIAVEYSSHGANSFNDSPQLMSTVNSSHGDGVVTSCTYIMSLASDSFAKNISSASCCLRIAFFCA